MAWFGSTAEVVGYVAAACTTAAFVPQLVRVWRLRSARDISLVTFVVFSAGTAIWWLYGVLIGSWPVIVANGVTLAIALTILALKVRYDRQPRNDPGIA